MAMPYYYKSISKSVPEVVSPPKIDKEQTTLPPKNEPAAPMYGKRSTEITAPNTTWGNAAPDSLIVETNLYKIKLSSAGGGSFQSVILKKYNEISGKDTNLVELVPTSKSARFLIRFVNNDGDSVTINQNFTVIPGRAPDYPGYFKLADNDSLTLNFILQNPNNQKLIERSMRFYGNQYNIFTNLNLDGVREEMATDNYDLVWEGGLAYTEHPQKDDIFYSRASAYGGNESDNLDVKSGKSSQAKLLGSTKWTAIKTKYFTAAFIPQSPGVAYCLTGAGIPIKGKEFTKVFNMYLTLNCTQPNPVKVYIGPLDYSIIKGNAPGFERLMNFGFNIIRPISKAILWTFTEMHRIVPNYGWVLIIFSILLKIALTPLTNISTRSMKEMQQIQPQLNALQEKYASDPQRLNNERLKIMREHNVNPMGGCLPILIQMPVLWALFIVFRTTIELRQAPFIFWIRDLSAPDTIFTLPFSIPLYGNTVNVFPMLMALSQLYQQKISGASGNQQQKTMMYFMTIFFFFLFNQFPSGLNLYYTLYNILAIAQQKYLPPKSKPHKKHRKSTLENLRQYQMKMNRR